MAATELGMPEELDERERAAVESLLYRLADDELVIGERYTEWQVRAPTLESDLALSNIAQDEFGHARLWYDLLEDFGYTEADLIFERPAADFRHSTLCERPFEEGDWADAIVRSYLYDMAEVLRLEAIAGTSYRRLADRVEKVLQEERYHREHAQNWLERLTSGEEGRRRVQAAVERLFPHALTLFVPSENEADIEEFGLRTESLDSIREQWLDTVVPFLASLGVDVPDGVGTDDVDSVLPAEQGRDGSHTEAWPELHDEMTSTYRELDRKAANRIMPDPDEAESS